MQDSNQDINLDSLSAKELLALTEKASKLIKDKEEKQLRDAYEMFEQIADEAECSIEDILAMGEEIKKERKIKYRDPEDPENTWVGHGRQPKWLDDKIKAGATLSDFEVSH